MSDSMSINGLYSNPYAIMGDPCFQQYMKQYNQMYQNMYKNNPAFKGKTENTSNATTKTNTNTDANSSKPRATVDSESSVSWGTVAAVGGTVFALGAAALCHKKGNGNLGEGAKVVGKEIKEFGNKALNWIKGKGGNLISGSEPYTIQKVGENTVCSIPGKTNTLKGADIVQQAQNLGIKVAESVPELKAEGTKIEEYVVHNFNGGNTLKIKDGKLVEVLNPEGKSILNDTLHSPAQGYIDFKKTIDEFMAKVAKKEESELAQLTDVHCSQVVDGVTHRYQNGALTEIATNRFFANDEAAVAFGIQNPKFGSALDNFVQNKTDGLRIAKCTVDGIEYELSPSGDKIIAFVENGQRYTPKDDHFIVMQGKDKKETFERIIKGENITADSYYV